MYMHTYMHTYTRIHMHTHTRTHTHARTRAHTKTHTITHTHAHTNVTDKSNRNQVHASQTGLKTRETIKSSIEHIPHAQNQIL